MTLKELLQRKDRYVKGATKDFLMRDCNKCDMLHALCWTALVESDTLLL